VGIKKAGRRQQKEMVIKRKGMKPMMNLDVSNIFHLNLEILLGRGGVLFSI